MKLTDRMKDYYLQEKFFKETGTYYYAPQGKPADYIADDIECEEDVQKGCISSLLVLTIILALLLYSTFKFLS
jgi:hypothetical protein